MNMVESGVEISSSQPLSELTVGEVGRLLESIEFDEYKAVFAKNKIDGKCLMKCNTVEVVVNMGISIVVKASLLLDEIRKWKTTGVLTEYFLVNPVQLIELSTAEDMKEMTVKTSTLLDEITKWKATKISMEYFSANQAVVEDNNNNAEDSEVDDTFTIPSKPVVKNDR
jgi:hypothetical protein